MRSYDLNPDNPRHMRVALDIAALFPGFPQVWAAAALHADAEIADGDCDNGRGRSLRIAEVFAWKLGLMEDAYDEVLPTPWVPTADPYLAMIKARGEEVTTRYEAAKEAEARGEMATFDADQVLTAETVFHHLIAPQAYMDRSVRVMDQLLHPVIQNPKGIHEFKPEATDE